MAPIALAVGLAFPFGYSFTLWPLLRARLPLRTVLATAFAADTISMSIIETVDNGFVVLVPGALATGLADALFWWSLALGLALAFVAAVPAHRWVIARGRGHAVVHAHQSH